MRPAIPLRDDFDAAQLRGLAQRSRDSAQTRRLLAVIYDGRSDAARFAGVGLQIIRGWVLRFNAEGPKGLKDRKASGPQAERGAARGAGGDLAAWIKEQFGVSLAETTVGRELREMGYAKLSARHYAQDESAAFKKTFRTA